MDAITDWQSRKSLADTNRYLLENSIGTDIQFTFNDGTSIKAHKLILMSRSTVFYVMFEGILKETEKDIKIVDIEHDIFKEMLRFMYTEEATITNDTVYPLLYAAEKYQILHLKDECGQFLGKNIESVEKAIHLLSTSKKYHVEYLYDACKSYLGENISSESLCLILDKAVFYKEGTLVDKVINYLGEHGSDGIAYLHGHSMSRESLNILLECNQLVMDEGNLFALCNSWAVAACQKKGLDPSPSAKRELLGSLLYKIHFPTMTPHDFAKAVSLTGMLTLEEEVSIFRYMNGIHSSNMAFPIKGREGLEITHALPGEIVNIKCGQTWALIGLKVKTESRFISCCIYVDEKKIESMNLSITPQADGMCYFSSDTRSLLTFAKSTHVRIHLEIRPEQFAWATTYSITQHPQCLEWNPEILCSFDENQGLLTGIIYQIRKW